jgi:hypothetical protein
MTQAKMFYKELVANGVVNRNEELLDRLVTVNSWQEAMVTLFLKAPNYRIKFYQKSKDYWKQLLEKYNFSENNAYKILEKVA